MRMKKLFGSVLALALALSLVACQTAETASSAAPAESEAAMSEATSEAGSEAAGDDAAAGGEVADVSGMSVSFIPKLTGNSFFEGANDGAQAIAEANGFTADYNGSPEAAVANQVQLINTSVQQGYDAIAISSLTVDGLNQALEAAMDAGLKVVCWDSDVQNEYRSLHVAQGTPEQLGEMLVEMVAGQLTDEQKEEGIDYVWHYSSSTVTDQNSWQVAGEEYIAANYPNWNNLAPDNFYSEQDAEQAVSVGESILQTYPDVDAIICPDSTALPGQAQAKENLENTTTIVTGFATPNAMRDFVTNGTVPEFGLWDCVEQGAMGAYLGAWLAAGNTFTVGDTINIPEIGEVEVMPNTVLDPNAYTADDSGVVVMPERLVFTADNIGDYDF